MDSQASIGSPFLRRGTDTRGMMVGMLICLTLTAAHYALRYDAFFAWRYPMGLALGGALDILYTLLKDGRPAFPRASTFVTTALLVLSVPAHMPWWQVATGILVAVWFGKRMVNPSALRLNPMLLGRLFMMIAYPDSIQTWLAPGTEVDALTSATPLGLLASEGVVFSPLRILVGDIHGNWEGVVAILPGSPGEMMPLLSLLAGVVLYLGGIADWRPGVMFITGFALACLLLGMPLDIHLAAGSILFTAVYIVSDPRSMPGSKSGRIAAGLLAGILNAAIRKHGFLPEGVVPAVLAVNLLSPTLDRIAFHARSTALRRRTAANRLQQDHESSQTAKKKRTTE